MSAFDYLDSIGGRGYDIARKSIHFRFYCVSITRNFVKRLALTDIFFCYKATHIRWMARIRYTPSDWPHRDMGVCICFDLVCDRLDDLEDGASWDISGTRLHLRSRNSFAISLSVCFRAFYSQWCLAPHSSPDTFRDTCSTPWAILVPLHLRYHDWVRRLLIHAPWSLHSCGMYEDDDLVRDLAWEGR